MLRARVFFLLQGFGGQIPRSPLHDVSNRLAHALTSNPPHSSFHRHQEAQEAREDLHEGYGPQVPSQPALLQEAPERWQAGASLGSSFSGGCCARAHARASAKYGGYLAASFANISFLFKIDPLPSSRADALREVPSGGTPKEHRNSRTFFARVRFAFFYPSPFARFPRRRGYDFIGSRFSYTRYVHG